MRRLLDLNVTVGDAGRRLAYLQLLWLGYTLLGGVVLGAAPATAAVHAVLRRDLMVATGVPGAVEAVERDTLWREFGTVYRQEFVSANVLGLALAAAWAVVVYDHRALRGVEIAAGPVLEVVLWVVTAVLVVVTSTAFVLHAHFAGGPLALVRRSLVLALGRPLVGLAAAGILVATLCLYYLVPGLAVVFGVVGPAAAIVAVVWRSGVLPMPPSTESAALAAAASPSPTTYAGVPR